jgi:hypothetical protein
MVVVLYRKLRLLRWIIRASRCTDILIDLVISKDFAVSCASAGSIQSHTFQHKPKF